MIDTSAGIPCAYCGGRHAHAADVRRCWEVQRASQRDRQEDPTPAGPRPATPPPSAAGPVLGRSVLVRPGEAPPPGWADCERLSADAPLELVEAAWRDRRPLVIEADPGFVAGTDDATVAGDDVERRHVWSLGPDFAFEGERRRHAVGANAVDARSGEPRLALSAAALALGAGAAGAGEGSPPADVVAPDGTPLLLDGGPLHWRAAAGDGQAAVVARTALLAGSLEPFGPNESDAGLAPDQLAAVLHPGGAARIVAPAGSGKTRVLTERARHLLRRWRLPGRAVTLVAFNKRAADEMRERTPDLPELQVRTLNALGLSLLAGSTGVRTIDERDVRAILDRLVDLPRRANTDPAAVWIEALSTVRLGLRPPEAVEAELGGDVDGLPRAFDAYRRLLADERLVDFDEQIYRAIELLLADPAARRRARASCRVMLVDELQDLTPAHLLLVRLLAGPDGAVFGVGDDDQTIYGYTGASPEWLLGYRRFFPTAGEHPLTVNYRCPVRVVEAARTLLTHNRTRVDKAIEPAPGRLPADGELEVVLGGDGLEADVGAADPQTAAREEPGAIAVLARVNAALVPVQVALSERGVPVRSSADAAFLSRGAVQAALAWLRLATGGPDRLAGRDVALAARRPSRALSPRVVEWMAEQRSAAGLRKLAGRIAERDADKVDGFVADLGRLRTLAATGTTEDVLRAVRDDVGLDRAMELLERSRHRLEGSAQTDDLDALVALARLQPDPAAFEPWLRRALEPRPSADGVVLSTIHRVKGREWPHVVLHGVSAGLLPHRLATDLEEERRVFHVGLTRASATSTIVTGDDPSPFVAELAAPFVERAPGARRAGRTGPAAAAGSAAAATRTTTADAAPATGPAAERARELLRAWRTGRSVADRKPPYVYLHDATIEALADALPASMAALARVKGIGPGKLEAYGDELLALLVAAREATAPASALPEAGV